MRLARDFYEQPTVQVAQQLLGKYLVRVHPDGVTAGMILETEAYVGLEDKASHGSRGLGIDALTSPAPCFSDKIR
jgi:DNA-3-methyladenine glycosylase